MRARIMLSALVVLPLAAAQTWAQTYTLKIKEYADAGKSSKITDLQTMRSAVKIALGDKVLNEDKKIEVEEKEFTEKVIKAGAGKPDKYSRTFSKAVKGKEGAPAAQSYAGKTIVFERKGNTYVVTAEEDGVSAKDLKDFTKHVNKPGDITALLPKAAVKVGDTWTVGKEILAFVGADDGEKEGIDVAKMKAQGKLVKAYKKGNEQWGTLEFNLTVPLAKLGPLALDTPIDLKLKMTLDTAIDGSSTAGQGRGTINLKGMSTFTQNGMTFTFDLAISGEIRRDATAEE